MTFSPDVLLKEVHTLQGLKEVHFTMAPCWLKLLECISPPYTPITFAFSDPNGTITNKILLDWTALFGKEIMIEKWIDKPPLIQCLHCHVLGHPKLSKACPLSKDSVKCHFCGGAHKSEEHDQKCLGNHAVTGICNCKHYKCLNCHKPGHNCRDVRCPAWDLYRPKPPCNTGKCKDKGKGRVLPETNTDDTESPVDPMHKQWTEETTGAGPSCNPMANHPNSCTSKSTATAPLS